MNRSKQRISSLLAALGVVAVLAGCGPLGGNGCKKQDPADVLPQAVAELKAQGVTPALTKAMTPGVLPQGWVVSYVTAPDGTIVAASDGALLGQVADKVQKAWNAQPKWQGTGTTVQGADGKAYIVWIGYDLTCMN